MKIGNLFSSFSKATDFPQPRVLTITSVQIEKIGDEEKQKPVVCFQELEKGVVLGPTTGSQLLGIFGTDETDHWIGKQVVVFNDLTVSFRGNVGGIRFRAAAPSPMPQGELLTSPQSVPYRNPEAPGGAPGVDFPYGANAQAAPPAS